MSAFLRPRDTDAIRAELRRVATETGVPVVFGGTVHENAALLSEFFGTRTSGLRGLLVRSPSGLGGASMLAGRPMAVANYRNAVGITHDYDTPVLSEGIRSVLAVPVVVDAKPRAILYGAYRSASPVGDRVTDVMVGAARRLSHELRLRDEVDRRLRQQEAHLAAATDTVADPEQIREVWAGLRRLAADAPSGIQEQLQILAERLAAVLAGEAPTVPTLTSREIDVLAQVALGCTNAEAAQRLCIKPETVKSYLRSAAAKLGARTRHEAVSRARRSRLIP